MTITPAIMYWLTRLDGLRALFSAVVAIGSFALIFALVAYIFSKYDETADELAKGVSRAAVRILTPVWSIALIGLLFVPTTKEMAMIYVVPQITESRVVQQDIPELYDMGVQALKDWLKKPEREGRRE